jgi:hypothetical protein
MAKAKKAPKAAMARVEQPKTKQYVGESHSYDSNRPKKPQRSRYNGAAGAAY